MSARGRGGVKERNLAGEEPLGSDQADIPKVIGPRKTIKQYRLADPKSKA